jgi:hypothetical protein
VSEYAKPIAPSWKELEGLARRAIEDRGYMVCDANILFRANCPNIDLVVFGRYQAIYVQVKGSTRPAGKDAVLIDGSPWTEDQLFSGDAIYNKHEAHLQARLIFIVHAPRDGLIEYYLATPEELELLALEAGRAFALKPKRDGEKRKMFRKEVPRQKLEPWRDSWKQLKLLDSSVSTLTERAKLARLAAFAPLLGQVPCVEPQAVSGNSAEAYSLAGPSLTRLGENFCKMAHNSGWIDPSFDWQSWSTTDEGKLLRQDLGAIKKATAPMLSRLLTALIRADRFIEGSLADAFQRGHILAISDRAAVLLAD